MSGKCPSCGQGISSVNLERGPIGNTVVGPLMQGYTAFCPRCRAVLGIMPDPDSIARAIVEKLAKSR
jgi:hypothetical protein